MKEVEGGFNKKTLGKYSFRGRTSKRRRLLTETAIKTMEESGKEAITAAICECDNAF